MHGDDVVVPLQPWEEERHLAVEKADAEAITPLLADPRMVEEHLAADAQLSADDGMPVLKKPRGTQDGEASGSRTAPIVHDISSDEED